MQTNLGGFPTQNSFLPGGSPAVVTEIGCLANHPVAGNDKRNGIFTDGTAHRPRGTGDAHLNRHILVGNHRSKGNFNQSFPDFYLEIGTA